MLDNYYYYILKFQQHAWLSVHSFTTINFTILSILVAYVSQPTYCYNLYTFVLFLWDITACGDKNYDKKKKRFFLGGKGYLTCTLAYIPSVNMVWWEEGD